MIADTAAPAIPNDLFVLWVVSIVGLALAYTLWLFVAAHLAERRRERLRLSTEQLHRSVAAQREREEIAG